MFFELFLIIQTDRKPLIMTQNILLEYLVIHSMVTMTTSSFTKPFSPSPPRTFSFPHNLRTRKIFPTNVCVVIFTWWRGPVQQILLVHLPSCNVVQNTRFNHFDVSFAHLGVATKVGVNKFVKVRYWSQRVRPHCAKEYQLSTFRLSEGQDVPGWMKKNA